MKLRERVCSKEKNVVAKIKHNYKNQCSLEIKMALMIFNIVYADSSSTYNQIFKATPPPVITDSPVSSFLFVSKLTSSLSILTVNDFLLSSEMVPFTSS